MPAGRDPFTGRVIYRMTPVDIDEDTLQKIANMTGGKYYRADNARRFQAIYAEIDKLEKTEADVKKFSHHDELFAWLISPGLGQWRNQPECQCQACRQRPADQRGRPAVLQ